jgi:hypothetical protein
MFLPTTQVEARPGYRLYLGFNNGITGEVNLIDELWGEVFEPLTDANLFAAARQLPLPPAPAEETADERQRWDAVYFRAAVRGEAGYQP